MKYVIDRVTLHWGLMPVKLTFSYGKVDSFSFGVVRIFSGDYVGIGEGTIVADVHKSVDEMAADVLGQDVRRLDSLVPGCPAPPCRYLWEGFSIAIHDLLGKITDLPVHTLLGGKQRNSVPLMPCIFPDDPEQAGRLAEQWHSKGFKKYLKTKLSGNLNEDLLRIKAIRQVVPGNLILQADANEGYKTFKEALEAAEILGEAGLDIFEDPLLGVTEDYKQLTRAKSRKAARIMTDKLSRTTVDLVSLLRADAVDVIGIHPDQPGSLTKALLHIRLAQSFGVPVVLGGTGYTGPGAAAYHHLAVVAQKDGPCGELGGFMDHGMPRSLVKQSLSIVDGSVHVSNRAGLSVDLDEDALAQFEHGQKTWKIKNA